MNPGLAIFVAPLLGDAKADPGYLLRSKWTERVCSFNRQRKGATMQQRREFIVDLIGLPSKVLLFTVHKGMRSKVHDKSADEPLSGVGDSCSFFKTTFKTNRRRSRRWIAPPVDRYGLPRMSFRKLPYIQIRAFNPGETFAQGGWWMLTGSGITTRGL